MRWVGHAPTISPTGLTRRATSRIFCQSTYRLRTPIVVNRRLAIAAPPPDLRRLARPGSSTGRFARGDRMPSSRELAAALRVSRATVAAAYDQLIAEGYLDTAARIGHVRLPRPSRHRACSPPGWLGRNGRSPPPARVSAFAARLAADRVAPARDAAHAEPVDRRAHVRPVSLRGLEAPGAPSSAGARPEPVSSTPRTGPATRRCARRSPPYLSRSRAVRCDAKPGGHRERIAAGAGPVRTRADRPGRRRRGGEPGLPRRARALRGQRGARAPGRGRRRRPGRAPPCRRPRASSTSRRRTSSRPACRCRWRAGSSCSSGRAPAARSSSKTTTTASTATAARRCRRCRDSAPRAGWSTWARFRT